MVDKKGYDLKTIGLKEIVEEDRAERNRDREKALYEESHRNIIGTPTDEIESAFSEAEEILKRQSDLTKKLILNDKSVEDSTITTRSYGGRTMSKMLNGTEEIRNQVYGGVSESTLMDYINNFGLPAERGDDAVYRISEADLKKWEHRDETGKPSPSLPFERIPEKKEAKARFAPRDKVDKPTKPVDLSTPKRTYRKKSKK